MPQTKQRELGETTESGSLQGPIDHLEQSNALGQVQFKGRPATDPLHVAAEGVSGSAHALPHSDRIQESFGSFDIRGITAYTGPQAQ